VEVIGESTLNRNTWPPCAFTTVLSKASPHLRWEPVSYIKTATHWSVFEASH
jgi:hypothetical protein